MRRGWWLLLPIIAGVFWYFLPDSRQRDGALVGTVTQLVEPKLLNSRLPSSEACTDSDLEKFTGDVQRAESFLFQNRHLDIRHYATAKQLELLMREDGIIDSDEAFRDPWGTRYHVHPLSQGHIELRSAGSDREMFTADDLISM